jgi:hypothetical protein
VAKTRLIFLLLAAVAVPLSAQAGSDANSRLAEARQFAARVHPDWLSDTLNAWNVRYPLLAYR